MKEKLVPILLLSGVAFATFAYNQRVGPRYDVVDNLRIGVEEVMLNTSPAANFSFAYAGDTTQGLYAFTCMRYILAPRHLSNKMDEYDTLVTMCDEHVYERVRADLEDNRRILMRYKDNGFFYLVTCNK